MSDTDSLNWVKIELSQDVGEELAEQYQENLLTLRILAKFLGFLEALPYSTEEALTEEISEVDIFNTV